MSTQVKYTEETLVPALKTRSESVYSYLYDNYAGALHNVIMQIVKDEELANDVLQDVFINIWRKIETYDATKGRLFTWMLNISRNAAIDVLRSRGYQNSKKNQSLPDNVDNFAGGQVTQTSVDNIGLMKTLARLKPEHRVLVELAYFKGYTHEEIAKIEGIPLGTVKTRIRNALLQLRAYLD